MRAIGIPMNMFTVMFAIGRMPGWIAHWKEVRESKSRIYRPRQIYTGHAVRNWLSMAERDELVSSTPAGVAREPVLGH